MSFAPKGKAIVHSVDYKNGTSDDAHASIVVSLTMEGQPASVVRGALGADSEDVIESGLFRSVSQDADRNPAFLGIKSIKSNAKWENHHAVKFQHLRQVRVGRVGAISLLPRGHATFDISFDIVIDQPPAGFADSLAQRMHVPKDCEFEHDTGLNLPEPEGGQTGAAPAAKPTSRKRRPVVVKKAAAKSKSIGNRPARKKPAKAAVH